jgi:hypothetical protein
MDDRQKMEDLEQLAYLRNWQMKKDLEAKRKQEEKDSKKKKK